MITNKDIEFKTYTLGDIGVIELLIAYRYKYDENLFISGDNGYTSIQEASGGARVNTEVIATYTNLDKVIKACDFNESQQLIIRMIGEGYSHSEIADELNIARSNISRRIKSICNSIYKENEKTWKNWFYTDMLPLKKKVCSKCKQELPAIDEFFSRLDHTKDGFHSQCRKCKK